MGWIVDLISDGLDGCGFSKLDVCRTLGHCRGEEKTRVVNWLQSPISLGDAAKS